MACSVFCANFLIDALYDGGRAADALRLMTGTGQRSWLHMIEQGAGSPMEAWDPALKSNTTYSHPWAGSPAYLVYRGALGIEALEPGYKRFSVTPQPGALTRAAGHDADRARDGRRGVRDRRQRPGPRGRRCRRTAPRSSRSRARRRGGRRGLPHPRQGAVAQSVLDFAGPGLRPDAPVLT